MSYKILINSINKSHKINIQGNAENSYMVIKLSDGNV